ncbi:MAG: hypothetical protein JWM56_839 [Candidatus Peribacteria bacterium]|nr:hypothetical protein [Candidatus Peribacteria bacterium]
MADEKIEIKEDSITQPAQYEIAVNDHRTYRLVYYGLGVIEVLLVFRFFFKLSSANPGNVFAALVYGTTTVLVLPFQGLFKPGLLSGGSVQRVFEPTTIIALIVYPLLAWGIAKLLLIIRSKPTNEK